MNLVGKILTVLIFVMSLVFMSFAVAVYATHKNWRDVVENPNNGLAKELKDARSRNQELTDQQATLERERAEEQRVAEQVRAKLLTDLKQKKEELDAAKLKENKLDEETRLAVETMKDTQAAMASLRGEVDTLRKSILQEQKEQDLAAKNVLQLTDELHQRLNELKRLKDLYDRSEAELQRMRTLLSMKGVDPDSGIEAAMPPEGLNGRILAVTGADLVTISIGSDDGLRVGHKLEVVRTSGAANIYVGRIEVREVHPDQAVCQIDPNYLRTPMRRGDIVTSKIQTR